MSGSSGIPRSLAFIGRLGDSNHSLHHWAVAVGTMLAGLAALLSCFILWLELDALTEGLRRQTDLLDQPMLNFSEQVSTNRYSNAVGDQLLEVMIPVRNLGTGVAHGCGVYYVESLSVVGEKSEIFAGLSDEEARQKILGDCDRASEYIRSALKYQEETRTSHVDLRIGPAGYTLAARRLLTGTAENFNLYCAIFFQTQSGRSRMATAWYAVDVNGAGEAFVTPRYIGYIECSRETVK